MQVAGASVELAATAAPLAEVLDRLSRQTGMKVVYEGPAPRQLVTVTVRGRTPAQTVLAVLEGQGVNYALVTDADRRLGAHAARHRSRLVLGQRRAGAGGGHAREPYAVRSAPGCGCGRRAAVRGRRGGAARGARRASACRPGSRASSRSRSPRTLRASPGSPGRPERTPHQPRTRPFRTRDRWRRSSSSPCRRSLRCRRRPLPLPLPHPHPTRAARPVRFRRSSRCGTVRRSDRRARRRGLRRPRRSRTSRPPSGASLRRCSGLRRSGPGPDVAPGGRTPPPGCGTAGPTGRPTTRGWPGRKSHSL